ncbi:MarC family protein [bacterium]|nr:MarC family protein [bacterium]
MAAGDPGNALQALVALIAIANPLAAVPVFLSLVPGGDAPAARQAATRVALAVFAILIGAVVGGRIVLEMFGISFAAFRVGGGLVVTLAGLDMLRSGHGAGANETVPARAAEHLIVPVAMPLIAGPGTIITAMTMTARAADAGRPVLMIAAVAVVAAFVWVVLALSSWVQPRLGERGQAIVARFMGLVLVAIGAQLVLTGIADFFGLRAALPA